MLLFLHVIVPLDRIVVLMLLLRVADHSSGLEAYRQELQDHKYSTGQTQELQVYNYSTARFLELPAPTPEDYDCFKLLLVGNASCGKSCYLLRLCDDNWTSSYFPTQGIDFKIKTCAISTGAMGPDKAVKMQLWDTSGQECRRNIRCNYYRGVMVILLCYDITDRESFTQLSAESGINGFMSEVERFSSYTVADRTAVHSSALCTVVLIGLKADREADRQVSKHEAIEFAKLHGFPFFELSAKSGSKVEMEKPIVVGVRKRIQASKHQQHQLLKPPKKSCIVC